MRKMRNRNLNQRPQRRVTMSNCPEPLPECIDRLARIETKLDQMSNKTDWVKIGMIATLLGLVVKVVM